jgi:hypothetical protein
MNAGGRENRGLQNRLRGAVKGSWVGSIPIHPRHISADDSQVDSHSTTLRLLAITCRYRERTLAMVADATRGSLGYSRLLRLANDGDAAAAEEESALVPVLPPYAVVDPFAGSQHLKDLSLTGGLPSPLRLENHPISDLTLNHRRTSLKCRLCSRAWYRVGMDSKGSERPPVQDLWAKWGRYVALARSPDTLAKRKPKNRLTGVDG